MTQVQPAATQQHCLPLPSFRAVGGCGGDQGRWERVTSAEHEARHASGPMALRPITPRSCRSMQVLQGVTAIEEAFAATLGSGGLTTLSVSRGCPCCVPMS